MWTGGMHPRGGEPSKYNPWETWVNNRDIDLTDTTRYHIDGSWLDNGEYWRAFKGIPSKKEVNIFIGGGYTNTSASSIFLAGGIANAVKGLGLWGLSALLKKRNQAPQQATLQANWQFPFQNYFTNLSRYFTTVNTTPTVNPEQTAKSDKPTDPEKPEKPEKPTDPEKPEKPTDPAGSVDPANPVGPADPTDKASKALAVNKTIQTLNIDGEVSEVGKNNSDGYPESFKVTDGTGKKEKGKETVYTYTFVGIDNSTKQPMYKISHIVYYSENNKTKDITDNVYTINSGVNKGEAGKAGSVDSKIQMSTESQKPAIARPGELGKGQKFEWPAPKKA